MKIIEGDVDLMDLYLEELPEFLDGVEVTGNFDCSRNNLTSLKNAPAKVGACFDCSANKLRSLEGAPKIVGRTFFCERNRLQTLEGAPEIVGSNFWATFNSRQFTESDARSVCRVGGNVHV